MRAWWCKVLVLLTGKRAPAAYPCSETEPTMIQNALLLGAVAYDPMVVTIWDGFQACFARRGIASVFH